MMHLRRTPLAFLLVLTAASSLAADEKTEPPLSYTLRINDESIRLVPGAETEIKGAFKDPKVTLVPDQHRLFTHGGVSFNYPANFAFEADFDEPGLKSWTLDGSDFVIMLHRYENLDITPADIVETLKAAYGPDTKTEKITHTFNGKEYSGIRVRANVASTNLIQDVLALPAENGSRLLILQDLPPAEKTSEKETELVLKLLTESFKP